MQYGHMPLPDRDPNGSSTFHQNGLGQALGNHLSTGPSYRTSTDYRNPSTSPPTLAQPGSSSHAPSSSHSPLTFTVAGGQASPAIKRKQVDNPMNSQGIKRRRDTGATGPEDPDSYGDIDGSGQGAKHWTDEEKTKLFTWLMAPGHEEHWNSLRATKNSCLRDCAQEVFGGKKTYQALKGCYERNFNLFKQIYAFETTHGQTGSIGHLPESDRIREYERRLQIARKAGSDVGNITARTIDHWHRHGWYGLFYHRWHGDPATTRPPTQQRNSTVGPPSLNPNGGPQDDEDEDPNTTIDFGDPSTLSSLNGMTAGHDRQPPPQHSHYISPQTLRENPQALPPPPQQPQTQTQTQLPPPNMRPSQTAPPSAAPQTQSDMPAINLTITQEFVSRTLHYLNVQTQVAQEKLEYMRRREAREHSEHAMREKSEKAAFTKTKTQQALDTINNPNADGALKSAATEYLRRMFLADQ